MTTAPMTTRDNTTVRTLETPIGPVQVVAHHDHLVQVRLPNIEHLPDQHGDSASDDVADRAITQLGEYFDGRRVEFDLPLDPTGTAFQREVWFALDGIPYGETASYAELAARVGRPTASRAVGSTNARNPLPIVLPCHRVIGSNGSLIGYGGGLGVKRALLDLEARHRQSELFTG